MRGIGGSRVSGLALLGVFALASPVGAGELMVTAGGGFGGVYQPVICPAGLQGCEESGSSGSVLLGTGISHVSGAGVRGALRLEGALAFGQGRGHHANLLGAVGWQGERLVLEAGLGPSLLGSTSESGTLYEPGGLLHSGLGVRVSRTTVVLARADLLFSERLYGTFLGLALEWLPFRP